MALRQLFAWRSVFIKSASSSELRILVDAQQGFRISQVRTLTRHGLVTPSRVLVLRHVQKRNAIVRQFRLQTDVAMMLTNRLIETEAKDKNFVYSPVSIHLALSVLAAGAKGKTLDQLLSFLKSKWKADWRSFVSRNVDILLEDGAALDGRGPKLAVANGVWIDESLELNEKFDRVVNDFFNASVKQVDFQNKHVEVINEVNSWACEETNGLIKDILLVGSVNHFTRLILTNAICFSGEWVHKFDPSATKFHHFHLLNGRAVRAPFMTNNRQYYIAKFDEFKVLELPFIKDVDKREFSMYIFLPDANDGLPALAEKFYSESGFLDEHIPWNTVKLDKFLIPKFKISFGFGAKKVLKDLGLMSLFEGSKGLTEMVNLPPREDIYVAEIFHKSFIEVNEHGTEAAAAAAETTTGTGTSFTSTTIDFVADHPFLFVMRENSSGMVLFIGHVLNPLENSSETEFQEETS